MVSISIVGISKLSYAEKRRLGLCPSCTHKTEPGFALCAQCRNRQNEHGKKRRAKSKVLGLCYNCGRPSRIGKVQCEECYNNHQKPAMRRAKNKRRTAGKASYYSETNQIRKKAIMDHYGPGCKHCGETELIFLNLDHISNDGSVERKVRGTFKTYSRILKLGFPEGYQCLCWNCNRKKALQVLKQKPKKLDNKNAGETKRRFKLKIEVLSQYGGLKCSCCGNGDLEVLAIDHINGGANQQYKQLKINSGGGFYRWLRKNHWPSGYRVLCFNCNCGRELNGGICPHQVSKLDPEKDDITNFQHDCECSNVNGNPKEPDEAPSEAMPK